MKDTLNINVGVLGHVDSGKTSLVACLSEVLSVAALDRSLQSQARGITLDIGLSSFKVPCPEAQQAVLGAKTLQFTLVDCPGHASLVKTVLVGAQIIDMTLLVIDATKGIQTQTGECIILSELLCNSTVVALNKTDLFPDDTRRKSCRKVGRAILKALKLTRLANSDVVPVSAKGGAAEGIEDLKQALTRNVPQMERRDGLPFLFMADHCFQVKGHGTVLSGTVLHGRASVGDAVEIPHTRQPLKIRSLQCFKQPVQAITAGDRAGICVSPAPNSKLERSYVAALGLMQSTSTVVCAVRKCRFYSGDICSRQKAFVTFGHQTRMAKATFFGELDDFNSAQGDFLAKALQVCKVSSTDAAFDMGRRYCYLDKLYGMEGRPIDSGPFGSAKGMHYGQEWVLLELDQAVVTIPGTVLISTKLDLDLERSDTSCRIMFSGAVVHIFDNAKEHKQLSVIKTKYRLGVVDRVERAGTAIVKGMFKKETNLELFIGRTVLAASGAKGTVIGSFGQSGKVRIEFEDRLASVSKDERIALVIQNCIFD